MVSPVTLQSVDNLQLAPLGAGDLIDRAIRLPGVRVEAALLAMAFASALHAQQIEAEAWTTQFGLQTEATSDVGGGLDVYGNPEREHDHGEHQHSSGERVVYAAQLMAFEASSLRCAHDGTRSHYRR